MYKEKEEVVCTLKFAHFYSKALLSSCLLSCTCIQGEGVSCDDTLDIIYEMNPDDCQKLDCMLAGEGW